MSELSNQVSTHCSRCGTVLIITAVRIDQPDPDGKIMNAVVKDLTTRAVCDSCRYWLDGLEGVAL